MAEAIGRIEILSGGQPVVTLTKDQPFTVHVEVPTAPGETAAKFLTVKVTTAYGTKTVTLQGGAINTATGTTQYYSNPLTLGQGGEGADSISLFGKLAVSWGDLGSVSVDNGATVTVSYDNGSSSASRDITAYDTIRKEIFALSDAWLRSLDGYVRSVLIALKNAKDVPATRFLKQWAESRLHMLEAYKSIIDNPEWTDVERSVTASEYAQALRGPQIIDARDTDLGARIRRRISEGYQAAFDQFLKDFAIGVYQFTLSQLPLVSAGWTVFTGQDIFGNKLDGWEYAMNVLDAAGQAAMLGASVKFSLDHAIGRTTTPIERDYPTAAPEGVDITKAPAGTLVRQPEDYGMLGPQAKEFNRVIDMKAVQYGHDIEVWIRPTNRDSLGPLAEGLDGKPEPIKAKSINQTDLKGGWAGEGTEGTIGYYSPDKIGKALGVDPDLIAKRTADPAHPGEYKWEVGKRPDSVPEDVWDRAVQRVKEYWNEKPMMDEITGRGLARVDANGQIINDGISAYGLDDNHNLVQRPEATAKGLGKPIAGDPDPYIFTDGKGNALPLWKQKRIEAALADAGVKHGAITAWDPHEPKNIEIKAKIEATHAGRFDAPTGTIVPANSKVENLVVFRGRFKPRVTGYGGFELPTSGPTRTGAGAGAGAPSAGGAPRPPVAKLTPTPGASGAGGPATGAGVTPEGIDVWWVVDTRTGAAWPVIAGTGEIYEPGIGTDVDQGDALDGIMKGAAAEFGPPPKDEPPPALPAPAPPAATGWFSKVKAGFAIALAVGGLLIGVAIGKSNEKKTTTGGGGGPVPTVTVPTTPASTAAPATTLPTTTPGSPTTLAPFSLGPNPVNAVGQFNGSGCGFSPTFTDQFQFSTNNGVLTIVQPSQQATVSGPINPDGSFQVSGPNRTYTGSIDGTSATATHVYTGAGCTAEYTVVWQLASGPVVAPTVAPVTQPATTQPATTAAPTTEPTTTVAPAGPQTTSRDSGVDGGLLVGGLVMMFGGIAGLLYRKKPCSCAAEAKAWQDANEALAALEAKDRAATQEYNGKLGELTPHQQRLDHWTKQLAPFEQYVADLTKCMDQLQQLRNQLLSMTGPLVMAGSVSTSPKPGWIQMTDHLWAKDSQTAAAMGAAASLYEQTFWNGMIGPMIYKQIAVVEWQMNFVNQQIIKATTDLQMIKDNIAAEQQAIARINAEAAKLKAVVDDLDRQVAAAKQARDRAYAAYEACKKACPDG